ncbi:hypothetical protein MON38_06555 [Hymenobacter sp. DH14]|uniref:Uncharacterized protein n=1 Tax=Hymenobacter cyanobacteriorum TaxID=2926463 RepID=A0A9X2AHX7_9BACT|nr:hypothetical protein [Hymenobacter cyanobacteriorum]MCI1187074.1 hypothetical protein [Hymenobacter cyanobacteriorum]
MGLKRVLSKGIAGVALLALAAACSHSNEPVQEPGHPAIARPAVSPPVRAVVAVPALLSLSVDALARKLGPPQPIPSSVQALLSQLPSAEPSDSLQFFRYRSLDVLVSYDAGTRRFNDLLLLGSNEDLLMQRAGLSAEASNYLLLPVFHARRPTQMLGLRVVPLDPKPLQ